MQMSSPAHDRTGVGDPTGQFAYCNNNQILLQNNKLKIKQFATKNERIKAALLNIFGVKVACVLFKLLHQL